MKKRTLHLLVVFLLITCIAFVPTLTLGAAKKDLGPLRIMWWGSQTRHDRTLAVIDLFTKQTGIQFEPEFYNSSDYWTKMNLYVASGDVPDLIQMGGNFPTYMDQIEPLNKYIKNHTIDTRNTDKSFIGITTLNETTVGLCSGTNATAIAYDPELFKKAGVPLPTFKWTWNDFEKAAMTIHEKLGILGCSLTRDDEFGVLTTYVGQQNKKESLFLEPYRHKLNYKNDKYVSDFMQMVYRLTKAGAYPNSAQMAEIKDIEGNPLVKGQSAMAWLYSNQFVALSNAAKRPLALVCLPRVKKTGPLSVSIMSSQMFCISKGSQHKEAAAQFISFFANSVDANKILKGERGVPIMKNVREALAADLTAPEKEIYSYLTNLGKEAATTIILDSPIQTQIRDIYKRLSEQVIFDKTTPESAAVEFKTEAQAIMKQNFPSEN